MIELPLTRQNRIRVSRAFAHVPRVDISIECVLEDQMGSVFVDDVDNPQSYFIDMDGFFGYLAGDWSTEAGRDFIANTPTSRMIMAGTDGWGNALVAAFGDNAMPIERYTYSAANLSLDHLQTIASKNAQYNNIQQMDAQLATVEAHYFNIGEFDSVEDFIERSVGFCLLDDGKMVASAYGGLANTHAIEVSIFVEDDFRRKGVATALACHLLQWCLERNLTPNWDAANLESCALAEKLGYTKVGDYTAYFLKSGE